ncbi:MAG TPA: hypothetical protein VM238_04020, partial [Phycisphaerae bacterium]|nr:hypothetical protein [Phycisphaerae bacterium]
MTHRVDETSGWLESGKWFAAAVCVAHLMLAQGCDTAAPPAGDAALKTPSLLAELPDYCPTPDGMAIDAQGNIVVACPNYGSYPADAKV